MESTAYKNGYEAYYHGESFENCPYPLGDLTELYNRMNWLAGFASALNENKGFLLSRTE